MARLSLAFVLAAMAMGCSARHAVAPASTVPSIETLRACLDAAAADATYGIDDTLRLVLLDEPTGVMPPRSVEDVHAWMGAAAPGRDAMDEMRIVGVPSSLETADGTAVQLVRERDGDCPTVRRDALVYDRRGRLVRWRHVVENCEYVDARLVEDAFTYGTDGELVGFLRVVYTHPVHVEALSDRRFGGDLALDDGTMPPEHERDACSIAHSAGAIVVACVHTPPGEPSMRMSCPAASEPLVPGSSR